MPGRPLPKSKLYEENRLFMATTILIIATSRSALFKIKRATRARSETRLPCRSSPFVSVLPVVGPADSHESLPSASHDNTFFARPPREERGPQEAAYPAFCAPRAPSAERRAVCTKQWLGQSPTGVRDAPMDGSRPVIGDDLDWEYNISFRYLRQNFASSIQWQSCPRSPFESVHIF